MFLAAKMVSALTHPETLLMLASGLGIALLFCRWWRAGRAILGAIAILVVLIGILPVSAWLVVPLEERFPPPAQLPERIDGIVVLGGAIDPGTSRARGQPTLNGAAERMTALVELARAHPQARIIFTGGSGDPFAPEATEAPIARDLLTRLGLPPERVIYEGQSRNTRENATLSRALADPRPGETWLLVTTAAHMPRSIGVFDAVGWKMIAYPVDYSTHGTEGGLRFDIRAGLNDLSRAAHEWRGLAYYRLRGWTTTLFPRPREEL